MTCPSPHSQERKLTSKMMVAWSWWVARGGEVGCPLRDLIPLSCQVARSVLSLPMSQNFALRVNWSTGTKPKKDRSLHQQAGKSVARNITAAWTRQNAVAGVPACLLLVGRMARRDKHNGEIECWAWRGGWGADGEGWARRKRTCIDTVCLWVLLSIPLLLVLIIIICPVLEGGNVVTKRWINLPKVAQLVWETGFQPRSICFQGSWTFSEGAW